MTRALRGLLPILAMAGSLEAAAARRRPSAPADDAELPRDPNDLPPLPPPGGQPRPDSLRWDPSFTGDFGQRRRLQLTLMPVYASVRLEYAGRPSGPLNPIRGGGAALELDIEILRPFWVRVLGSYTVHPVEDEYTRNDDDEPVQTAAAGNLHAGNAGLSVVYAMDLGRIVPLLDLGLGVLWLRSPDAVADGQLGGECAKGGVCDPGLVCAADSTCQPVPIFEVHGGLAVDILLGERWSVGAGLRYFALLSEPSVFPVYLQATARGGVRF